MAGGDIQANEVYADREMLNRLGYGIFDVNFGSSGVGSENIRDFSYVVTQDEDAKLYRRKVFNSIGLYYPNDLAKLIWNKFIDHKWVMSEQVGQEVDLRVAAQDWFDKHSHAFLKEWTFQQPAVPIRFRTQSEPGKGLLGLMTGAIVPNLRELVDAGFSVTNIMKAAISEKANPGVWKDLEKERDRHLRPNSKAATKNRQQKDSENHRQYFEVQKLAPHEITEGRYYVQLVANLTDHEPKTVEEAERRWCEILEHKWYLSERAGYDVGIKTAALDYFRRLNLLQEAETGQE